jgi:RES domain-containing protein
MTVYRFVHQKFAGELSGTGARLWGGRWNPVGVSVVYASESISLALLEVLANTFTLEELQMIHLMEITIPENTGSQEIKLQQLKKDWHHDFDYTQWMGQEILAARKSLMVQCPSAIVQKENNYLINPLHPDFKKLQWNTVTDFYFDERLFKHQNTNSLQQ